MVDRVETATAHAALEPRAVRPRFSGSFREVLARWNENDGDTPVGAKDAAGAPPRTPGGVAARLGIPADGWVAGTAGRARRIGLHRPAPSGERRLLTEQVLERVAADPAARRSLVQQLAALRSVDPELDPALVVAIAARESGPGVVSASASRFHTHRAGGLSHLGAELDRLPLPDGVGGRWTPEAPGSENEHGRPRRAAWVPRNEALVAYGAVLRERRELFEGHVHEVFGPRAADLLEGLDGTARRAWIQVTFGGPFGASHVPGRDSGRAFGVRTALEMLRERMATGQARDLNDVLHDAELSRHHRVRRALVTAAEAELLDGRLPG